MFVFNLIHRLADYMKAIMIRGNGKCFRIAENDKYVFVGFNNLDLLLKVGSGDGSTRDGGD